MPGLFERTLFATVLSATVAGVALTADAGAPTAPSCDMAAVDQFNRDTKAFQKQANKEGWTFLKDSAIESTGNGIKKTLKGNPTADALIDLKDKWNSFEEYGEKIRDYGTFLIGLKKCLGETGCSLTAFVKESDAEVRRWVESLGDEGTAAASERVGEVAELVQNYANTSLNISTGTMSSMQSCVKAFNQRGQPALEADAADPSAAAAPAAQEPPKPGRSAKSSIAPWVALGLGIPAAVYGYNAYQSLEETGNDENCGPQPSIAFPASQGRPSTAQLNALKAWCSCMNLGYGNSAGGFGCQAK